MQGARHGGLYLAWLNPAGGPGGVPLWQNAVLGDPVNNATLAEQDYQGSFATFQSQIGDTNLGDYIGAWGVDPANHDVWAVVDHNSDFAVVPEPSSLLLAGMAAIRIHPAARKETTLRAGGMTNDECQRNDESERCSTL